jgi:hypothetical protein
VLNFCGIVAAILKMETGRNFSMSEINSGHHNLPAYEMSLKSDNVEFVRLDYNHILLLLFLFSFFSFSFLSLAHELVHGRSQELIDRIS